MSIREDIISVKAGLVTLGNAIENITASVDEAPTVTNVDKSINFKGTESNAIYGKGLQWSGYGNTKTFSFQGNPDRIWSSNSIDLHKDASYSIDNTEVINATSLGPTIKSSNLKTVGVLEGLAVNCNVNLDSFVFYDAGFMRLGVGTDLPNGQLSVSSNDVEFRVQPNEDNAEIGTYTTASLKIQTDKTDRITIGAHGDVQIGTLGGQMKMNVYGKVGIGVNQLADNISLDVDGPIRFQGKRFHTGTEAPTEGAHSQGDITWNSNPTPGNVIGWVCTKTGTPGLWKSFGTIGD